MHRWTTMRVLLQDAVATALAPLCGLPLWGANRAGTLVSWQLGERHVARSGPVREVATYALHLQCPWRLSGTTGIVIGSADVFVPRDDDVPESEVVESRAGSTLVDAALRRWPAAHAAAPLRVDAVRVDRSGGFTLVLEQDFALETFPDASSPPRVIVEQWRLLQPAIDAEHFVMLNSGVE
jgi:hypothetical protein